MKVAIRKYEQCSGVIIPIKGRNYSSSSTLPHKRKSNFTMTKSLNDSYVGGGTKPAYFAETK